MIRLKPHPSSLCANDSLPSLQSAPSVGTSPAHLYTPIESISDSRHAGSLPPPAVVEPCGGCPPVRSPRLGSFRRHRQRLGMDCRLLLPGFHPYTDGRQRIPVARMSQARHPRRRLALPCELSAGRQSRWQPGRHPRQRSGISPGTLVPVSHIGLPASWLCTDHHQPDNCRRAKSGAGKSRPTTTIVNATPRGKRMRMNEWSRARINRLSILLPAIRQTSISIWSISIFFLDLRNCLH